MKIIIKETNLTFRKLKITDYGKFKKLFYSCFKKNISYNFYKWRYFSDRHSFCFGAFDSSQLIANVGIKSMQLNNKKKQRIFSRHSSMVLKDYRGRGIFSILQSKIKKRLLSNIKFILMWPNKKNFSNFGFKRKKILRKQFYIYKTSNNRYSKKKTINYNINQLVKYKSFANNNNSFIYKNFSYLENRYLKYKSYEYLINKFELKGLKSFYILKKNLDAHDLDFLILDHFGSSYIKLKHLLQLIKENRHISFWSTKKSQKFNSKLINYINLNIGIFNNTSKKLKLFNKEFMPGDTDSFITLK